MSANIETKGALAAFASRAVAAWHRLGTVFDRDRKMTTADMLAESHTGGWNVRLRPFDEAVKIVGYATTPAAFVVERDNPFTPGEVDALAVVGKRYGVVQNEDVAAFGDHIIDISGGRWETMGSLDSGRRFFGSLAFDDSIVLDPQGVADEIRKYLVVASSHDGTMPVTALMTDIRVVCANTLGVALRKHSGKFVVRHVGEAKGRVEDARKALGLSVAYQSEFEDEARRLIETSVTMDEFQAIMTSIWPEPEDVKGALTRWQNKIDLSTAIYLGTADQGDTNSMISGTAWGVVNALTERLDYYRTPRADNPQGVILGASGFDGPTQAQKQKIWDTVLAFADSK